MVGTLSPTGKVLAEPRFDTNGDLRAHTGVMESSQLLPKGEASLCLLRRLRLYSCAMAGDGDPI